MFLIKDEGDYFLDADSMWLTVRNISVHIKKGEDGVSISLYALGFEDQNSLAETWVEYSEAEGVIKEGFDEEETS